MHESCDCAAHAHEHNREHDHNHEHEHGHTCAHNHAHDHEHAHDHHHEPTHQEQFETANLSVDVEAHIHEQAASVTLTLHAKDTAHFPFSQLIDTMHTIARNVEERGGIVGHIKGFARTNHTFVRASVTAADLPSTCEGDSNICCNANTSIMLVAIALLIEQDALISICKQSVRSL